jgi:phosphatidylglycerol:prolipoprotein diacylglycerol transferase
MNEWLECFVGVRRVAICIPNPFSGHAIELFWYGVLASVGIFLGAWYASKHVEREGENPELVWDALLWVLIPALIGARLWYVGQVIGGGGGAAQYYLDDPTRILAFREGGMNIFGGIVFGLAAVIIYTRVAKADGWLLGDAALMGALIGQAIGRFGNWVNLELYGPPTELPWGVLIDTEEARLGTPWTNLADFPLDTTRFHPTFFYEAGWLFLTFGVLYFIHRRYQERLVRGALTGGYLLLAGVGRFWIEFFRADQPHLPLNAPYDNISFGRFFAVVYVLIGTIILLDRYDYVRIPGLKRASGPIKRKGLAKTPPKKKKRKKRTKPHQA